MCLHPGTEQGSTEWMEATVHRIVDGNGRVMGAIEHIRDITERKQTEELLKDEISRRRILVEQSRDGIVVLNRDGSVYEANKEYAHMLGYSVEKVYQLRIWEWNTDFSKQKLLEMLDTVGAEGDHFQTLTAVRMSRT
jgi:PAS domain-containing protein